MIKYGIQPSSVKSMLILFVTLFTLTSCVDINWRQTGYETARQNCKEGRQYQAYQTCLDEVDRNYDKAN